MLVYALIDGMVRLILWAVILLQTASLLLSGDINPNILHFGRNLAAYHYQLLLFLTFNTERLPFPFSDWNQTLELELPSQDDAGQ